MSKPVVRTVYVRGLAPFRASPDSKVHGANMGPTWVLSAPDGPNVGPMNLAILEGIYVGHGHMDMGDCTHIYLRNAI